MNSQESLTTAHASAMLRGGRLAGILQHKLVLARIFWVALARSWQNWRTALIVV